MIKKGRAVMPTAMTRPVALTAQQLPDAASTACWLVAAAWEVDAVAQVGQPPESLKPGADFRPEPTHEPELEPEPEPARREASASMEPANRETMASASTAMRAIRLKHRTRRAIISIFDTDIDNDLAQNVKAKACTAFEIAVETVGNVSFRQSLTVRGGNHADNSCAARHCQCVR